MSDPWSPRELSRLRVIEALFRRPGSSRTQVGQEAGLSRPTVAAVLDELEDAGIIEQRAEPEDDARPRPTGRPPIQIRLAPRAAFAVGLDFGHRHVRAALCDLSGQPVADAWSEAEVDSEPAASLDLAHELVRGLLERAGGRSGRRDRRRHGARRAGRRRDGDRLRRGHPPRLGRAAAGRRDGGAAWSCR